MRHRLRFAALALAAMSFAGLAAAEPIGSHWELTPFAGYTIFDGKLRFPGSNLPLTDNLNAGVRFAWESKSWYGIEAAAGFTPTSEDIPAGQDFDWSHASGNLVLSPARGRWGGPFSFVGGGWTQAKPSDGPERVEGTIEFGGGLKMWMTDEIGLRFEARDVSFKSLNTAARGEPAQHGPRRRPHVRARRHAARHRRRRRARQEGQVPEHAEGRPGGRHRLPARHRRRRRLRRPRPVRGHAQGRHGGCEGLPERRRRRRLCSTASTSAPDTPKGATVDAKGCPSDTDGDGVLDGIDQCPDTRQGRDGGRQGCPIDSRRRRRAGRHRPVPGARPPGFKVDSQGLPDRGDRARDRAARHRHDPPAERQLRDQQGRRSCPRATRRSTSVGAAARTLAAAQASRSAATRTRAARRRRTRSCREARAELGAHVHHRQVPEARPEPVHGEGLRQDQADRARTPANSTGRRTAASSSSCSTRTC